MNAQEGKRPKSFTTRMREPHRVLTCLTILIVIATLSGCVGAQDSARNGGQIIPITDVGSVAGTWTGGMVGPGGSSVQMQLSQTGTSISGNIHVPGRADVSGPLTGTVSGTTVRFRLTSGYGSTGELNVNGDTITGVVGGNGVRLRRVP